jgi:hypothetical protein
MMRLGKSSEGGFGNFRFNVEEWQGLWIGCSCIGKQIGAIIYNPSVEYLETMPLCSASAFEMEIFGFRYRLPPPDI